MDDGRANITIGRAEENDLVVKGNLISRLHARVEFNRNKFMLIDQSTNGTFVIGKDGEEAFVRRDSMQIRGEGLIGLGKAPDSNSSQVIRYTCEDCSGRQAPVRARWHRRVPPASACGTRSPNSVKYAPMPLELLRQSARG